MNFDQKASQYEKLSISQKQAADHLFDMLNLQKNDIIVDVGCGTGYLTEKIFNICNNISGFDIAPLMVEQAKKLRPHIDFYVFNAEKLEEINKYDCIITNAVTYYLKNLPATINKFYDALKINGKYALQAQTTVTPQFLKAISLLLEDDLTKKYYTNFKLNINHLNINEFLILLINCGFTINKAEMINYSSEYTLEEAFNIFKSGTATPFLDPTAYEIELTQNYIDNFWKVIYKGLELQLNTTRKIRLDVPRCYIIAEKL